MRNSRIVFLALLFIVVAVAAWVFLTARSKSPLGDHISVYYTKYDGTSEVAWPVSLRPQARDETPGERLQNAALYGAVQAVAGPPPTVEAIRFPAGTHVRAVRVTGSNADVDLSPEVKSQSGGSLGETGEFKGLVWTLTGLPGIASVSVRVDGRRLDALPGGHLELDKPLRRSDW